MLKYIKSLYSPVFFLIFLGCNTQLLKNHSAAFYALTYLYLWGLGVFAFFFKPILIAFPEQITSFNFIIISIILSFFFSIFSSLMG